MAVKKDILFVIKRILAFTLVFFMKICIFGYGIFLSGNNAFISKAKIVGPYGQSVIRHLIADVIHT